jgi:mRNA-degrading endonuclease RelE of RelBE toxin-antitoxin system
MNEIIVTLNYLKGYKKIRKKYVSFANDMENVINSLEQNAQQGKEIMPNVYKLRVTISGKNKGKSGGARLIFYYLVSDEKVILMYVYDKSETSDIDDQEIKDFVKDLLIDLEDEDKSE